MRGVGIDINQKYGKLIAVNLLHDFYTDNKCKGLTVEPTVDTRLKIQQYGLLLKQYAGEFSLAYTNKERLKRLLGPLEVPLKFSFVLKATSNYFLNYTDLPFKRKGACFHFSNINNKQVEEIDLLHKNEFADATSLYPFFPSSFEYRLSAAKETVAIEVKDEIGNTVWTEQFVLNGRTQVPIALSEEPSGRYQLYEDGVLALDFYSVHGDYPFPFGFLDIYLTATNVFVAPPLELRLKARSTQWKFLLINPKAEMPYKDFELIEEDKKTEFLPAEDTTLMSGKQVKAILSKELLPFSEKPLGPLELKFKKLNGKSKTLIKSIPSPSYEQLVPGPDNKLFFAEIFVNI